ncbi:MAG: Ig-like domain-containing protein [Lachnospiraceae bacterium]|nr:Ig-like domain-containing protein [Lachnospiraceae bacterium]
MKFRRILSMILAIVLAMSSVSLDSLNAMASGLPDENEAVSEELPDSINVAETDVSSEVDSEGDVTDPVTEVVTVDGGIKTDIMADGQGAYDPSGEGTYSVTFDANGGFFLKQAEASDYNVLVKDGTTKTFKNDSGEDYVYVEIDYPYAPVMSDLHYEFTGWYTSRTGGEKVYDQSVTSFNISSDSFTGGNSLTYYAHYERKYNVVTFDAGFDEEGNPNSLSYWDPIYGGQKTERTASFRINSRNYPDSTPYDIEYANDSKVFDKWMHGEEEVYSAYYYTMYEDTTLTAFYKNNYTITAHYGDGYYINSYGEKITGDRIVKIPEGSNYYALDEGKGITIDTEGLVFDGWYYDAEYTQKVDRYNTEVTSDAEVWARYAPQYTVTFDAGDGWLYTDYDYQAEPIPDEYGYDTYPEIKIVTEDITVTDGNVFGDFGWVREPEHETLFFDTWCTDPELKNPISKKAIEETVVKGNITYYARYAAPLTATFDLRGGTIGGESTVEALNFRKGDCVGENSNFPSDPYKDGGYRFAGWYYVKDGTEHQLNTYFDTFDESVEFYAKYNKIWTVKFDGNGGVINGSESVSYEVTQGDALNYPVPREVESPDENKVFKGWFTDAACKNPISTADIENTRFTSDVTYYAGFATAYSVTFVANGGTFINAEGESTSDNQTVSVAEGNSVGAYLPYVANSAENKVFKGWFTDADCTSEVANLYNYPVNSNLTLYAGWDDCFVITFHANDTNAKFNNNTDTVKVKVVKGQIYRYGEWGYSTPTSVPSFKETPTGKKLCMGWYTNAACTGNYYIFDYECYLVKADGSSMSLGRNGFVPVSDMDLYAKWTSDFVTITYNANGGKYNPDYDGGVDFEFNADNTECNVLVPKGVRFGDAAAPYNISNYKDGYDSFFWGYYDAACKQPVPYDTVVNNDLKVYCKWTTYENSYDPDNYIKVTFHAGDGYLYFDSTRKEETVDLEKNPYMWNYGPVVNIDDDDLAFYGWYYDAALTKPVPEDRIRVEGNGHVLIKLTEADYGITDLYAKYGPAYKVWIYANGGFFGNTYEYEDIPYAYQREDTVSFHKLGKFESIYLSEYASCIRRDGNKLFGGWYTDADCKTPLVYTYNYSSAVFKPTAQETRIYAGWVDYEPVQKVTLSASATSVAKGKTVKVNASVNPSTCKGPVEWYIETISDSSSSSSGSSSESSSSSSDAVASISSNGTVTGLNPGKAIVYAYVYGVRSNEITITVSGSASADVAVKSVKITGAKDAMNVGETLDLGATVTPSNATNPAISWSVDDSSVATVSSSGRVTALKAGTVKVTATSVANSSISDTVSIVVESHEPQVTRLTVEYEGSTNLKIGSTLQLQANVQAEEGADTSVTWTSSNTSVATVDSAGLVTAVAKGEAVIKAKAGKLEKTITITVVNIPVTNIQITGYTVAPVSMQPGTTLKLAAVVNPANATDMSVTWSTTNAEVVTVDEAGLITAVANGEATINATANDGSGVVGSVKVTVAEVEVSSIRLRAVNGDIMVPATSQQLDVTVLPANAANKTLTWTVSDESVASVTDGVVTTKAEDAIQWGDTDAIEFTVTATAANGVKATVALTVKKEEHPVTSVAIDAKNYRAGLKINDTFRLAAVIEPSNATDKAITWTSANAEVATVDQTGLVTVKGYGESKITATATNGTKAEYALKIDKINVTNVTLAKTGGDNYLAIGKRTQLTADIAPADASVKDITWYTSNPSIATVDEDGYVTGISQGTVDITAKALDDKTKSASVTLTVFEDSDTLYVEFAEGSEFIYTGFNITPKVNVYNRGRMLMQDTDYTVKYANNKAANDGSDPKKAPKVTVTGKTVSATAEAYFRILPKDISDEEAIAAPDVTIASGKTAKPVLYFGGSKLGAKDFSNPYEKDKFTSSRVITVTGKGNFTGQREIWINVTDPKSVPKIKVASFKPADRTFNGQPQKLTAEELIVVSANDKSKPATALIEGEDYYIAYPDDITSAGNVKITIVGIGDYTGTVSKSYKIDPAKNDVAEIKNISIKFPDADDFNEDFEVDSFTYKPGGVLPLVEIIVTRSDDSTEVLSAGKDYKVAYKDNKKATATNKNKLATATITFLGNYKKLNKEIKKFYIDKADLEEANTFAEDKIVAPDKSLKYVLSKPIVDMDNVTVSDKEYTVTYYVNGDVVTAKDKMYKKLAEGESILVDVEIEAKDTGNYQGYASTCQYYITAANKDNDLSKATVIIQKKGDSTHKKVTKLKFTGKEIRIGEGEYEDYELYVTIGPKKSPIELIENEDFYVEYSNNVNAGKATIVLNAYNERVYGSKKFTFTIEKGTLLWAK